jgi:hypothetical protein
MIPVASTDPPGIQMRRIETRFALPVWNSKGPVIDLIGMAGHPEVFRHWIELRRASGVKPVKERQR